ncbi:hypothetical protein [Qipengyuania flava]|uniref:hypothetical protein n=1 Tax=Qipengyuania flava TaxID=192812 RepID=UPI00273E42B8|nr:hypothetical protein [Qipengyuania flava]
MAIELKAVLIWMALALGISAPLPDLIGGMVVGLAATYAGFLVTPAESRMTVWATLFTGLIVCVVFAIAHPQLPFGLADLRLQLVLAVAGFASRWIAGALASFGKGAVARAGKIPSELRLPWGKD